MVPSFGFAISLIALLLNAALFVFELWTLFNVPLTCAFAICHVHFSTSWPSQPSTLGGNDFCRRVRGLLPSNSIDNRLHVRVTKSDSAFSPVSCGRGRRKPYVLLLFNATLGFPGEGPISCLNDPLKYWSISTLNIGSLKTSSFWKGTDDQAYCLQETRIGKNNWQASKKLVEATHKTLFCGELLSGIMRTDGHHITMHGGTAIVANSCFTRAFDPSEDISGKYTQIFSTKRANACWIQATPSIRVLVFSVYAKSGASANQEILEQNDLLLADILEVSAQFGSIPVLIAGDLQTFPMNYPSVSGAIHFQGWHDPLTTVDSEGRFERPITFSSDRTFTSFGEGCSSLDAILVNQVAFAALKSIEVIESFDHQHRPIRACFEWAPLCQIGEIHCKFAELDHKNTLLPDASSDCQANQNALQLWEAKYSEAVAQADSPDLLWATVNDFCLDTLKANGAVWGFGKRARGVLPEFKAKKIFPGQTPTGSAVSRHASLLYNSHNRLLELQTRSQRCSNKLSDQIIFQRTSHRVWRALSDLGSPHCWAHPHVPCLMDIYVNICWVKEEIRILETTQKKKRLDSWKTKIRESALTHKKYIFHHLRNKSKDEPVNLVLDDNSNIVFNPHEAISIINDKWDAIFSANVLHADPMRMLEVIWPHIDQNIPTFNLPPLSGKDIYQTIQDRNPNAAAGLDGWRTADTQRLPLVCCDAIALFFRTLEDTYDASLPDVLTRAKQIILNKPGPSTPINKRLITILPPLFLAYSGTRFRQLQAWQKQVFDSTLCGGIKGRNMADISVGLRVDIDEAQAEHDPIVGIKLDQSKCFDRIVPSFAGALFLVFGMPKGVVGMFLKLYQGLK